MLENPIRAQVRPAGVAVVPAAEAQPSALLRSLRSCPPGELALAPAPTVDQARADMRQAIDDYLALPSPEHMLLVRATPGVGKTTAGIAAAEACAARGMRVAYAAPRHDFFQEVLAIAQHPQQWYEWLPRQDGAGGQSATCDWPREISRWMTKGYKGIDFCARICGYDYIRDRCPWHQQKKRPEPIIFIQHQHVAAGHPLDFHVLIGDENPLSAFLWQWDIRAGDVRPVSLAPDEPLFELLVKLAGLCAGSAVSGLALMDALGGPAFVLDACRGFALPASALAFADIHSVDEAERADHFHLPHLIPLLQREAEAALDDRSYPPRIIAGKGDLSLLLRRWPDVRLPPHVIWLDATANAHIYQELFGRPVAVVDAAPRLAGRVTVVTDRANGITSLKAGEARRKLGQAAQLVRRIVADCGYQSPAVVTFKEFEAELAGAWSSAHFYGARGTNRLEAADALFVVGAPVPARQKLWSLAAMVYFGRDVAFSDVWVDEWLSYSYVGEDGRGVEYPAGGFWNDADLQALVWQLREAEILQAVHRVRPVHRAVPIYLLTNLPIPELPVDRLATVAELLGVPSGARADLWARVQAFVAEKARVSPKDLEHGLGLNKRTAAKYWQMLLAGGDWEPDPDATAYRRPGAGNPSPLARRT